MAYFFLIFLAVYYGILLFLEELYNITPRHEYMTSWISGSSTNPIGTPGSISQGTLLQFIFWNIFRNSMIIQLNLDTRNIFRNSRIIQFNLDTRNIFRNSTIIQLNLDTRNIFRNSKINSSTQIQGIYSGTVR